MSQLLSRSRIVYFFRNEDDDSIQLLLANNSQSKEGNIAHIQPNTYNRSAEISSKSSLKSKRKSISPMSRI